MTTETAGARDALTHFLIITPNYYGRGKTEKEAWANQRTAGGITKTEAKRSGNWVMYSCGPWDYVDGYGRKTYYGDPPELIAHGKGWDCPACNKIDKGKCELAA